jgi:hypothetical protein
MNRTGLADSGGIGTRKVCSVKTGGAYARVIYAWLFHRLWTLVCAEIDIYGKQCVGFKRDRGKPNILMTWATIKRDHDNLILMTWATIKSDHDNLIKKLIFYTFIKGRPLGSAD